jgi:diguanylate cyclase (GGDEF)-like protein/PAS domain S-box-containing protein
MNALKALSVLLVLVGAVFIFSSFRPAQKTFKNVPPELRKKWRIIISLMRFFLAGYVFFDIVLISDLSFPVEIVTGGVFLGGAVFVFIIINLAQHTIQKIRDVEQNFQELFENANDLIQSVGSDGRILYVNRAWRETLGYAEDEISRLSMQEIVPPELRERSMSVFADVLSGKNRRIETVFLARDGRKIYLEGNVNCRYKDGVPIAARGIYHNITARKQAEEKLRLLNESLEQRVLERTRELKHSYEFNRTVVNSMNDPICIIDVKNFRIIGVNRAFLHEFMMSEEEALGKFCYEITHRRTSPCTSPDETCPLSETMKTGRHASTEHVHFDKDGKKQYVEVTSSPIRDEQGALLQVVHIQRDITGRKNAEEQIRFLAYYDSLTGLPNRTFYKELLSRALILAQRYGRNMATLFVDLDAFKRINDTLGHDAGDKLLQEVAARLTRGVRKSDYVARSDKEEAQDAVSRLGGDEFIVLLNEMSRIEDAAIAANRILSDLSQPFMLGGQEVFITASIGISLYPTDGADVDALLKAADIAMYHAKNQGKNNFQFYARSMNAATLERLNLENELHRAIERNEFLLYYQPKLDAKSRKVVGIEALIRWKHPDKGMISPAEFIPLAEESGMIVRIGEWVLNAACRQNRAWRAAGLPSFSISVNLSNRQFGHEDLIETVTRALKDVEMDPSHLELEITESTIMQNPEKSIATLRQFKEMGIRISIDDFGTGYSSLNYLRRIPFDSLKIDRSFVMNINTSPDDAAIVRAIIAMAHSLKLRVIAEGVEKEEQFAFLRELGCDEVQGYFFSKPLPAEECVRFITSRSSCSSSTSEPLSSMGRTGR